MDTWVLVMFLDAFRAGAGAVVDGLPTQQDCLRIAEEVVVAVEAQKRPQAVENKLIWLCAKKKKATK